MQKLIYTLLAVLFVAGALLPAPALAQGCDIRPWVYVFLEFYDLYDIGVAAPTGDLTVVMVEMNRVKHAYIADQLVGGQKCLEDLTASTLTWMNKAGAVLSLRMVEVQGEEIDAVLDEALQEVAEAYNAVNGDDLETVLGLIGK